MEWALIFILLMVCVGLIASGLRHRGGVYEFPFLAGTTFLGFVLPQMPALADDAHLPDGAFAKAALFTALCALACGLGWAAGQRPSSGQPWAIDKQRALGLAAVLSGVGAFFYYKMSMLPKEVTEASLYTGLPVAYLFFGKLLSYGLYLALLCSLRWRSRTALLIASLGAALLLHRVVILGRRSELTELLLIVGLSAWFVWGMVVPRTLALAGALLAGLALNSTGHYRAATANKDGHTWSDLSKIEVISNFSDLLRHGGPEMRNAVLRINDADRRMTFDFGLFHWNVLVFNFVPAQLVGNDLKQSLIIAAPNQADRDYDPPTGSTETGMADAFASFWYLGCLKFFLIAYALSRLYWNARHGSMVAQIIYMASVVPAMLAITHHTQWMVSTWVHMAILFLPGLAMARAPAGAGPATARQGSGKVGHRFAGLPGHG